MCGGGGGGWHALLNDLRVWLSLQYRKVEMDDSNFMMVIQEVP